MEEFLLSPVKKPIPTPEVKLENASQRTNNRIMKIEESLAKKVRFAKVKQERLEKKQKEEAEKKRKRDELEKQRLEKKEKEAQEKIRKAELREQQKKEREEKKSKEEQEKKQRADAKNLEKENERLEKLKEEQATRQMFSSFFVSKQVEPVEDLKVEKEYHAMFHPFTVSKDQKVAPMFYYEYPNLHKIKPKNTQDEKIFSEQIQNQNTDPTNLLIEFKKSKSKILKKSRDSLKVAGLDEDLLAALSNIKLLMFHTDYRPPYRGTWSKKTKKLNPRNPFKKDTDILDYDYDSEDEWEDEPEDGEDLGSDNEKEEDEKEDEKEKEEEEEEEDEFVVPDGYLSDEERDGSDDEKKDEDDLLLGVKKEKNLDQIEADKKLKAKLKVRGKGNISSFLIEPTFDISVDSRVAKELGNYKIEFFTDKFPIECEELPPTEITNKKKVTKSKSNENSQKKKRPRPTSNTTKQNSDSPALVKFQLSPPKESLTPVTNFFSPTGADDLSRQQEIAFLQEKLAQIEREKQQLQNQKKELDIAQGILPKSPKKSTTQNEVKSPRKKSIRFTDEEITALSDGVSEFGEGCWKQIHDKYKHIFHPERQTSVIAHKWTMMKRNKAKQEIVNTENILHEQNDQNMVLVN